MIRAIAHRGWTETIMRSDVMVALGLVTVLLVMIIPLPSLMLDLFLSVNITLSLLILIISLYIVRALEFAVFPSLLLATTLFRLSLNVASTRLILLNGEQGPTAAGTVIRSFGQFVVGGDYVVGIVIFAILVIINFMVITKGAGRVAEVSARFTLDALPGKQMAIDADLNAGLINEQEARTRRQEITQEADFYGAMDGASKFVRGDAIAGIIITLINISAGFVIGVLRAGMPMAEAAQTYTVLTVGDGLVSQIPALIISTAAGILVTRTAGTGDFGSELKNQFTLHPRALWIAAGILLGFALIPGLPHIPFFLIALILGGLAHRVQKGRAAGELRSLEEQGSTEAAVEPEEITEEALEVDYLELEVGYGLISLVDAAQQGELLPRIRSVRKQFALDMGFIVPPLHIRDNLQLQPNEYAILLKGVRIAGGEVLPEHYLAMDPGTATETVRGTETVEPAFGLPAIWIPTDRKDRAQVAGYTVVDGPTVLTTHLSEIIKKHAYELIGRQEVQNLLDAVSRKSPKLVEELIPNLLPLGTVMRVLQNLLRENVSIRDMRTILETLADWAPATQDPDVLTEYIRQALARSISARLTENEEELPLITLAPSLEESLKGAVRKTGDGTYLAVDPDTARSLLQGLSEAAQNFPGGRTPVLLCSPTIRPHVKKLTERYLPALAVLSHNEIASNLQVRSVGTVNADAR